MKYKIIGLAAAAVIVVAAFLGTAFSAESPNKRIHQHLESRGPSSMCSCDGDELCTHLPLIIIDTDGKTIPGEPIVDENRQEIGFTVDENGEELTTSFISVVDNETSNNHPSDNPKIASSALIRIRGNSSRYFDKKNYLIRFTKDDGSYENYPVAGMDAHYEWALHGPFLDKSLIRNYMWYNIAGEIMDYAPNVRFCELILNGEYQGLYVLTETITSGENSRLNLTEPMQGTDKTGYVIRLDRGSSTPIKNIQTFTGYAYRNFQKVDIKYPRSGDLTPQLVEAITNEVSDFEKALYSYDYDTDEYGYWNYIDTDSFVDYFIINEFTSNYDAGWLSTYMYKDVGGRYKMVIWDFNSACENYSHVIQEEPHIELQLNIWYYMLTKDEYFNMKVLNRYKELRKTYLSEEYLNKYMDDVIAYLGPAIDRNFDVWGYNFENNMIYPPERNPKKHEDAVNQMRSYIHERGEWMDENLEILLQYSHESKNKKFNH